MRVKAPATPKATTSAEDTMEADPGAAEVPSVGVLASDWVVLSAPSPAVSHDWLHPSPWQVQVWVFCN